jgi:2-(1,2-epoxy-1,2-dihydrophenyl)acetyl-CoA isomerase
MNIDQESEIISTIDDGVATITLNRPSRRNALTDSMIAELARLVGEFDESEDVGAVILTGAPPAFCAGGDVLQFNEQGGEGSGGQQVDPAAVAKQRKQQRDTVGAIYRSCKPYLAVLPGAAAGAGLGLALAADLRIGSTRAVMTTAFARVGLSGDYGTAWLLERQVGPAKARELMFLSAVLDAEASLQLGLFNWVVEESELAARSHEIATALASGPRLANAFIKSNLNSVGEQSLLESMDAEIPLHKQCGLTADHIGAVAAFAEKRSPTFGASR